MTTCGFHPFEWLCPTCKKSFWVQSSDACLACPFCEAWGPALAECQVEPSALEGGGKA